MRGIKTTTSSSLWFDTLTSKLATIDPCTCGHQYAPIIPRLKCLFRNKEHAKLLRWHKEDRKKDEKLRHPADGSQWRKIEREFLDFAGDAGT